MSKEFLEGVKTGIKAVFDEFNKITILNTATTMYHEYLMFPQVEFAKVMRKFDVPINPAYLATLNDEERASIENSEKSNILADAGENA